MSSRNTTKYMLSDVKEAGSKEKAINTPRRSKQAVLQGASRFPFLCDEMPLREDPYANRSGTPAVFPLSTGKEADSADAKARHASSLTTVPEEQAMVGRTKSHGLISRSVSLKNLLRLQSYSFISDVDCSEAQQAVDSSDSDDEDQNEHQYDSTELFAASTGTGDNYSTASSLPSLHNTNFGDMRYNATSFAVSTVNVILNHSMQSSSRKEPKDSNVLAVSPALPSDMKRSAWSVDDYQLISRLHNGYASKVYSAECKASGHNVVLKIYTLKSMSDLQRCQLFREIKIHSQLLHRNIVQFHCAFMEDDCVIIIQQFAAGGDLFHYTNKMGGRLTENEVVRLVLPPFLSAMHYLHTQGIIHRDIKPENILLTGDMVLQIADFGLAVDLKEERANSQAGTLDYMAPEVLRCPQKRTPDQFKTMQGAAHYELAADSWSVGVLAYELLCGQPPFAFRGNKMLETAHNVVRGDVHYPKELSPGAVDFISSCLEPNPADRLTVIKMLSSPWIKMFERRKTVNNFQDGGASAFQENVMRTRQSAARVPIPKAFSMGRATFASTQYAQTVAASPNSPREMQRKPVVPNLVLPRIGRLN